MEMGQESDYHCVIVPMIKRGTKEITVPGRAR